MKNWRDATDATTLRAAVERLKRDCETAFYSCQEEDANAAHDDLVAAEWRLRRAERRA
jgi:outer membrane murein-binding lipoprotein Lpp